MRREGRKTRRLKKSGSYRAGEKRSSKNKASEMMMGGRYIMRRRRRPRNEVKRVRIE